MNGFCDPQLLNEFRLAGSLNDVQRATEVLRDGLDPNCRLSDGTPLLIHAITNGHARLIRPLLEAGAAPDVADEFGNPATAYAMLKPPSPPWAGVIADLKAAGATESGTAQTQFILACSRGATDDALAWLSKGAAVNGYGPNRSHGLIFAAEDGHTETVRALLVHGADPNLPALGGWTALMAAAMTGQLDAVKVLVEAGATPDVRRDGTAGSTARGYALQHQHQKVATYLAGVANRPAQGSAYADKRGVESFDIDCTLILIKSPAREASAEFARLTAASIETDVYQKELCLGVRSYLAMQFTGHQWTVISGLTRGTLLDPMDRWAEELSKALKTQAICYGSTTEDHRVAYTLFADGKVVQTRANEKVKSPSESRRAKGNARQLADAFLKKHGAYAPGYETSRIDNDTRVTLDWPDISPNDLAGLYCVTLPRTA